jgi:uncharacterized FlgJ-related protein
MLYTYCKKSLTFNQVKLIKLIKVASASLAVLGLAVYSTYEYAHQTAVKKTLNKMEFEDQVIIVNHRINNEFSKEALVEELKRLNIKFPHIVLAQSIIESGHFESNIFRCNHNLFGMKQARQRVTTALGTNLNHAYYSNWKESVLDYAMFQAAYLRDLKTEEAYLLYLDKNYAMAPNYDIAVKKMIEHEELKELFK